MKTKNDVFFYLLDVAISIFISLPVFFMFHKINLHFTLDNEIKWNFIITLN